jgi:stress-induced morphogen
VTVVAKENRVVYTRSMKHTLAKTLLYHFNATYIKVVDESHLHQGHQEVRNSSSKNTHFSVVLISNKFEGQTLIKRHRTVHQVIKPFQEKGLHALQLTTQTPGEWNG